MKTQTSLTQPLKKIILLCSFGFLGSFVQAQSLCDSIYLNDIRYNAVDDQIIDVGAWTDAANCISYPSFVLFSSDGDTLAIETVDFFCLAWGSWQTHRLLVRPMAQIPNGPFDGRLELFSGFDLITPVCSWEMQNIQLCPPDTCTEAVIYLFNGSTPFPFTAYWWIADETGNWTEDGYFEVDTLLSAYLDTVCLPPGNYSLNFSPFSPIQPGYVIGITNDFDRNNGTNTTIQNDSTPLDLNFSWFGACANSPNSIQEHRSAQVELLLYDGLLQLISTSNDRLIRVQLFAPDGRLARSLTPRTTRASIPVGDLSSGIYLVHILTEKNLTTIKRIFIP